MKIEQFNEVIELIENGLSLRKACEKLGYHRRDFHKLVNNDAKLNDQYTYAREERSDLIFEEILNIADDSDCDTITKMIGDELVDVENKEFINRSKVRIDARKWMLGKMQPKKYGDKLDVTTDGEKINNIPNVINVKIVNPIEEDDESDQF